MSLKDDAKAIFQNLLGPEISKQIDNFDNPEKYPRDFLEECVDFLGKFIGKNAAEKKFEPLYKKYSKET